MDLIQKESVSEEMNEIKKSCVDCKATKTPLWRGGPAGPKSLCNACGIRHRKKRRAMVGLNKGPEKKKEKPAPSTTKTNAAATTNNRKTSGGGNGKGGNLMREDLRVRLMALGKEVVVLQRRQRSPMKRQRSNSISRKLGEEEQAAILLMALSCGSVFA